MIDERHELHLKLPEDAKVGRAEVIIMFEDSEDLQRQPAGERVAQPLRKFGQFRGQIQIGDDFNEPLPDEFWLGES
ncbi:MAG: hypothetical protein WA885_06625 [Phormidesmis sp.]